MEIVNKARSFLKDKKFDLMSWGTTSSYNKIIEGVKLSKLPQDSLIIMAGNTSDIWQAIQSDFDQYSRDVAQEL